MISGDAAILVPGEGANERFMLQASKVEALIPLVVRTPGSALRALFWRGAADVVTVQDPFWRGLIGLFVARRLHAKLNVQLHADLAAQSFIKRALAHFVLHRANSVRVVSERLKQQVEAMRVQAPVRTLSIFVDPEPYRALSPQPHEGKNILWVGRFEPEKDPLYALEVLQGVRAAGIDARLVMLGKGSLWQELNDKARGLPVEFPGRQDPKKYLPTADLLLNTSPAESWGAAMVEALAAGVPVVAPDVGVAREAGAIVAARSELAKAAAEALHSGVRGNLRLSLPDKGAWAAAWLKTLH